MIFALYPMSYISKKLKKQKIKRISHQTFPIAYLIFDNIKIMIHLGKHIELHSAGVYTRKKTCTYPQIRANDVHL